MPPSSDPAQSPWPTTPAEAAAAAFEAHDARDWPRLVSLVHPDALEEFKRAMLDILFMRRHMEELGDEFSEAPVERDPRMLQALFEADSLAEAESLTGGELFVRYCRTRARSAAIGDDAAFAPPEPRSILGVVAQTEAVAHVVFQEYQQQLSWPLGPEADSWAPRVRVITARRDAGGAWRVMLNGGLFFDESGAFGVGWSGDDAGEPGPD